MKERRKMIEVTRNVVVPDIVNQKCREAYDRIYSECEQKNENKNFFHKTEKSDGNVNEVVYRNCEHETKKHRFVFKRGIAMAACAAVISAGVIIPAASKYAPSLKSAFGGVNQESGIESVDEKAPGDADELKETSDARDISQNFDIEINKVYSDGNSVYVGLVLTPKESVEVDRTTTICGKMNITVGGKTPESHRDENIISFARLTDGKYYSDFYCESADVSGGTPLEINITDFWGENLFVQHGEIDPEGSVKYKPEKTAVFAGVYNATYNIEPDLSHNMVYEVHETRDGITLDTVEITPFTTTVYIYGVDEEHSVRVIDTNGYELGHKGVEDMRFKFEPPCVKSDEIIVEVFSLYEDGFPTTASFSVPIDNGFAYKYTMEVPDDDTDYSKIVYDPPFEELEEENKEYDYEMFDKMKVSTESVPLGSAIEAGIDDSNIFSVALTDYKVGNIEDYDLDVDQVINGLAIYENEIGNIEGAVLMLITCEIENFEDKAVDINLEGLQLISKEYSNDDIPDFYKLFRECHYVSYKENFGKSSYLYNFKPHEKKTITFGYVVPDYCEEKGYWACFNVPGYQNGGIDFNDILNGNARICEIK